MSVPLHGGHSHSGETVGASPELVLLVALVVVLVGLGLHVLLSLSAATEQ